MRVHPSIALVAIALLGMASCTSSPTGPVSSTPSPTAETTAPQGQQTVKISGAGAVYPALEVLAKAYEATSPTTKIVFLPTSQTTGGITAVKNDLADIGAVTRSLKADETSPKITFREFAQDALLVATHNQETGVTNLTAQQLRAIYSGQIQNWQEVGGPDRPIVVLDRPEDESAKKLLRQYYLGNDLKISSQAVVLTQEKELAQTVADTPDTIGAFSLGYASLHRLSVNRLSLDGIAPTVENVQQGKYKMVRTLGLVVGSTPSPPTQSFVEFIFSAAGQKALKQGGFVPVNS